MISFHRIVSRLSIASGVLSAGTTYPLEVARKRMMVGSLGSNRKVYRNMIHALKDIAAEDGVGGLFRGIGPSSLKCLPASGLSWTFYEACKNVLGVGDVVL